MFSEKYISFKIWIQLFICFSLQWNIDLNHCYDGANANANRFKQIWSPLTTIQHRSFSGFTLQTVLNISGVLFFFFRHITTSIANILFGFFSEFSSFLFFLLEPYVAKTKLDCLATDTGFKLGIMVQNTNNVPTSTMLYTHILKSILNKVQQVYLLK